MNMNRIFYHGPGNSWNVIIEKSIITGERTQIADVKFRTAVTFLKTHTKAVL